MDKYLLLVSENQYNKINVSEYVSRDIKPYFKLDMYEDIFKDNTIIISSEYATSTMGSIKLVKFIDTCNLLGKKTIFVSKNNMELCKEIASLGTKIILNIDLLDTTADELLLILSRETDFIGNDKNITTEEVELKAYANAINKFEYQEILEYASKYPFNIKSISKYMLKLIDDNKRLTSEINVVSNARDKLKSQLDKEIITNSRLFESNKNYKSMVENLKYNLNELQTYVSYIEESITEWKNNGVYNINPYIRTNVDFNKYPTAPIVLYFKEYSKVRYTTSYLSMLLDSLSSLFCKKAKLLILENGMNTQRTRLYPNNIISNNCDISSLCDLDIMVKFGNPKDLLDFLGKNELALDVLVIYDRTYKDSFEINNIYRFNISNSELEINKLGLDKNVTLTNLDNYLLKLRAFDDYKNCKTDVNLKRLLFSKTQLFKLVKGIVENE